MLSGRVCTICKSFKTSSKWIKGSFDIHVSMDSSYHHVSLLSPTYSKWMQTNKFLHKETRMDSIIHLACRAAILLKFSKNVSILERLRVPDPGHLGPPRWAPGSLLYQITPRGCPLALVDHVLLDRGSDENQPRYYLEHWSNDWSLYHYSLQDFEDGDPGPNINIELVDQHQECSRRRLFLTVSGSGRVLHQRSAPGTPLHCHRGRSQSRWWW